MISLHRIRSKSIFWYAEKFFVISNMGTTARSRIFALRIFLLTHFSLKRTPRRGKRKSLRLLSANALEVQFVIYIFSGFRRLNVQGAHSQTSADRPVKTIIQFDPEDSTSFSVLPECLYPISGAVPV